MSSKLFSTYALGTLTLQNRVVMAPMTRNRAIGNVPNDLMVTYYAQRASAGLIVTEGVSPSANGLGYARIPGLFTAEHVAGWRKLTDAVHAGGAKIFVQFMHTGRASHTKNLPAGARVLAPSAIALGQDIWCDDGGNQPATTPEAMSAEDLASTRDEFVHAAQCAVDAGFDGVELHAANGYLLDQFLNTASNQRTDAYGGSIENRARYVLEVAAAVAAKIGAARVGIRVAPYGAFNAMQADPETHALFTYLAGELSKLGLAYLHVVDHSSMGAPEVKPETKAAMRAAFKGAYVLSGGYDGARAEADLEEGKGDLVAFGRPFIANPKLPALLASGDELAAPDFATFYTPGEQGYTDYPVRG
jgi:N-ethylmaleimide reductase